MTRGRKSAARSSGLPQVQPPRLSHGADRRRAPRARIARTANGRARRRRAAWAISTPGAARPSARPSRSSTPEVSQAATAGPGPPRGRNHGGRPPDESRFGPDGGAGPRCGGAERPAPGEPASAGHDAAALGRDGCDRPHRRHGQRRAGLVAQGRPAARDPVQDPGDPRGHRAAPTTWSRSARSASGPTRSTSQAAAERGIAVFNAPFSNTRSVVELAVAEIIALTRRLTERDTRAARRACGTSRPRAPTRSAAARWASSATGTSARSCRCSPSRLGMSVVFYDSAEKLALGNARRMSSLDGAARRWRTS